MPASAQRAQSKPEAGEIVREMFESCGHDLEEVLNVFAGSTHLRGRFADETNMTLIISLRQLLSRAENAILAKRTPAAPTHRCFGGHAHENLDGAWSIYFDDMEQLGGFKTREDCEAAMRTFFEADTADEHEAGISA